MVDELLAHPYKYEFKVDKSSRSMIKLMRMPYQVLPLKILQVFCGCYDVEVWVHHGLDKPVVYTKPGYIVEFPIERRLHLQCLAGVHFNPLKETNLYVVPEMVDHTLPPELLSVETNKSTIQEDVGAEVLVAKCPPTFSCNHTYPPSTAATVLLIEN
jgi:hypothetical protein